MTSCVMLALANHSYLEGIDQSALRNSIRDWAAIKKSILCILVAFPQRAGCGKDREAAS